jgi:hypothetical protein
MKKIKTKNALDAAQELLNTVVEIKRKKLCLKATDLNTPITSTLTPAQIQIYHRVIGKKSNVTVAKLIELCNAIEPSVTITLNVE